MYERPREKVVRREIKEHFPEEVTAELKIRVSAEATVRAQGPGGRSQRGGGMDKGRTQKPHRRCIM